MTTAPTLDAIDPRAYPYPMADWRDAEAYPDHGSDATWMAWELTRRDRRFQLLCDVQRASYARETGTPPTTGVPERIVAAIHGLSGMESVLNREAALDDSSTEPRGLWPWKMNAEERLRRLIDMALTEWFTPFDSASDGDYRADLPPADRPVLDRRRTPPWPLDWPGKDAETRDAHALLDLVGYPAGVRREILMEMLTEAEKAVVEGRTIGSLEVHAQASAYSSSYYTPHAGPPKHRNEVRLAFDLSANAGAQAKRAQRMLEGMQRRAGIERPSNALSMPRGHTGRRILRYLDWKAEGGADRRGAPADFKRAIGIDPNKATTWSKLEDMVVQYTRDPVALTRLR